MLKNLVHRLRSIYHRFFSCHLNQVQISIIVPENLFLKQIYLCLNEKGLARSSKIHKLHVVDCFEDRCISPTKFEPHRIEHKSRFFHIHHTFSFPLYNIHNNGCYIYKLELSTHNYLTEKCNPKWSNSLRAQIFLSIGQRRHIRRTYILSDYRYFLVFFPLYTVLNMQISKSRMECEFHSKNQIELNTLHDLI